MTLPQTRQTCRCGFEHLSMDFAIPQIMNADAFVKLVEEMVELKVRIQMEANLKTSPEVAKVLYQKQESDRRRLELLKTEMARQLVG